MSKAPQVRLALAFTCIALLTFSIFFVRSHPQGPADYLVSNQGDELLVEIPAGASGGDIASILLKAGVIKSTAAFFGLAVTDPRSSSIAPGTHRLSATIPARIALDQLLDSKRIANLVKIAEGSWSSEVFAELEKNGISTKDIHKSVLQVKLPSGITSLEGTFFPAQYSFAKGTTAILALQKMVDRFTEEAKASGIYSGTSDFSFQSLLTIASLVQAEGDEKDFAKISQVIRNRLKLGMPLEFDTSIHFIKKVRGQIFLSTASTKIPSLYNTYLHTGLPPGAIGNPGRKAMDAAITPESGDWIFFITVAPGDTRFTSKYSEFSRWKSEYERNLRNGVFK
ncbi:MAG: endolytic transglycosylase MltG [Actinobacteria bacterium]|nr:endolytic transglycosylase MltG [Actinomycetota bacterium]